MKRAVISIAIFSALGLSACDTTSPTAAYSVLPNTTLALQSALKAQNISVRVGEVTKAAAVSDPNCRLAGALDVTSGKSLEEYFKSALQAEILAAQSYDVSAPTAIDLRIDHLEGKTFGTGTWTIGLTLSSNNNPTGYSVSTTHTFKTSFSAVSACKNAAQAFVPSVQDALGEAIADARFATLVR